MSFPLDQGTSRALARVQQHEQKRAVTEQMTLRAARTRPRRIPAFSVFSLEIAP